MLAIVETHPIQYHAPVWRCLGTRYGVPVAAIYGSDFSVAGYQDAEFGTRFAWDTDLLSGYRSEFLSRVDRGGARSAEEVAIRGLGSALREAGAKAVLVVGYSPRFHQAVIWEAWRSGLPMIFRGETADHAVARWPAASLGRDLALRWLYGRCERLLYVGQRSLEHFRRLGCRPEKLVFSPYCVDSAQCRATEGDRGILRAGARAGLALEEQEILLLFSGKLSPRKAPDLLLRAAKLLPADTRDRVVVAFLGGGEMRASLEALAGAAPRTNVRFLGFQNQSCLSEFYHAADLLVLPSLHSETWGLVVNEALLHGVPAVVSDAVGCAPDLVETGVTGESFEAGSLPSLVLALRRGLALAGRPEVRERCRQRVAGYSIERAAGGIAQAYYAVAGARQAATPRI